MGLNHYRELLLTANAELSQTSLNHGVYHYFAFVRGWLSLLYV